MNRNSPVLYCLTFLLLFLAACETPEKVMKSNDLEYKYNRAVYWYNKKEYTKCIPLFEELIGLYKGTKSTEEIYFFYANANFHQGDFLIAAYHFKNFTTLYPLSTKAEEALFMHAESYMKMSPKPELDQTQTYKAIEAYQLFLNTYPDSKRVPQANEQLSKLRKKLEKKALMNADLYFRTGQFKAAATCFDNITVDFPDIDQVERIRFMVVKSHFQYAENSIYEKKAERYNKVIDAYNNFEKRYPTSKYLEEAKGYLVQARFGMIKAPFEYAQSSRLDDREKYLTLAINEHIAQQGFITDPKQQKQCNQILEQSYFYLVKNNYLLSEDRKDEQKLAQLEKTVASYYTFVDKYKNSKYSKEAEKIFTTSTESIKKIKQNGQN